MIIKILAKQYGGLHSNIMTKNAFTLIELSIVLVIIGLLVGGVLVGQDLIQAGKIRAAVSEIQEINTAVNTYRLKYNAIPGDHNDAFAFFAQHLVVATVRLTLLILWD